MSERHLTHNGKLDCGGYRRSQYLLIRPNHSNPFHPTVAVGHLATASLVRPWCSGIGTLTRVGTPIPPDSCRSFRTLKWEVGDCLVMLMGLGSGEWRATTDQLECLVEGGLGFLGRHYGHMPCRSLKCGPEVARSLRSLCGVKHIVWERFLGLYVQGDVLWNTGLYLDWSLAYI